MAPPPGPCAETAPSLALLPLPDFSSLTRVDHVQFPHVLLRTNGPLLDVILGLSGCLDFLASAFASAITSLGSVPGQPRDGGVPSRLPRRGAPRGGRHAPASLDPRRRGNAALCAHGAIHAFGPVLFGFFWFYFLLCTVAGSTLGNEFGVVRIIALRVLGF